MENHSDAVTPPRSRGPGQYFDEYYETFSMSHSNDQLNVLKTIVDRTAKQDYHNDLVHFLAVAFIETPFKHAVKGFIMRHISKVPPSVEANFSNYLSFELKKLVQRTTEDYIADITTVYTMSQCMEFPAGIRGLWLAAGVIVNFIKLTLQRCLVEFRKYESSPYFKKDISNHCHETLRLLLFLIQRYQSYGCEDPRILDDDTQGSLKIILINDELPMDTKSLCGIILLRALVLEFGEEDALKSVFGERESWLLKFMTNDTEMLVIFSALATKPMLNWTGIKINGVTAVVKVLQDIINIGERASSDAAVTLIVARTVHQFSELLGTLDRDLLPRNMGGSLDHGVAEQLTFHVQSIIDHSMDSVRYLAGETMNNVAIFYNKSKEYEKLKSIMGNSNQSVKRSYFLMAGNILCELDESPKEIVLTIINTCIASLYIQEVQAAATICLESIIAKCNINDAEYLMTIVTNMMAHLQENTAQENFDPMVLEIYDRVMTKLLSRERLDFRKPIEVFLHRLRDPYSVTDTKLLSTLVLLRATGNYCMKNNRLNSTTGFVYFALLKDAAVHVKEEFRVLALSIAIESQKSTKLYNPWELSVIMYFITFNINAQSPNFRQLTMSLFKKMVQRLQDSYKVILKYNFADGEFYSFFIEQLRTFCFESLSQGANTCQRSSALQIISMIDKTKLPNVREYTLECVEQLLVCLEDGFETNKALALETLLNAPKNLIKGHNFSVSLRLTDILREASSVRPTACESAAYKLMLLEDKFSDYINLDGFNKDTNILFVLLTHLKNECAVAKRNIALASAQGPMYGLVHCIRKILKKFDKYKSIPIIEDLISTCMEVNQVVAPIVNNSSPEGNLPIDLEGLNLGSDGEACSIVDLISENGVTLTGGQHVTAQMVLLCGWRTVKEVSLLFGEICSYRSVKDKNPLWLLTHEQIVSLGDHFISLLSETKHRGAFEQAYVGFTQLLTRLWASDVTDLHELPAKWLVEIMEGIMDVNNQLCSTRRSAGLPYIIQAILTTEIQVNSVGRGFQACMRMLLERATSHTQIKDAFKNMSSILELMQEHELSDSTVNVDQFNESLLICSESSSSDGSSVCSVVENSKFKKDTGKTKTEMDKLDTDVRTATESFKIGTENAKSEAKEANIETENIKTNIDKVTKETENGECSSVNVINETEKVINESENGEFSSLNAIDVSIAMLDTNVTWDRNMLMDKLDTTGSVDEDTSMEKLDTTVAGDRAETQSLNATLMADENKSQQVGIRTHSLNILRALYRNTNLGEAASNSVQQGLMVAITGLNAYNWQERNSATLLLNALIVRVFGVQRSKDSDKLSLRNKLTARIFFVRYPAMYEFMMDVMKYSELKDNDGELCHSLFGVLLILSRLYQSSYESAVSSFKLSAFVGPVMRCASNAVLQTRRLAAKAIASITPPNLIDADSWKSVLLIHLNDESYRLAQNLVYPNYMEDVSVQALPEVFNEYFAPKKTTFANRKSFYEAQKGISESIEEWVARLSRLAADCEFGTELETLLRDKFVLGMNPGPERDRLFEMDVATSTLAVLQETAKQTAAELTVSEANRSAEKRWHGQVMTTLSVAVEVQDISNHLHGTMLQLTQLLGSSPESVSPESEGQLARSLRKVFVIFFTNSPDADNYIIRSELLKALNQFTLRFQSTVISVNEMNLLTNDLTAAPKDSPYYQVYVRDLFYFSIILRLKDLEHGRSDTFSFVYTKDGLKQALETHRFDSLKTVPYDLLMAEMNVIILAYGKLHAEKICEFQKHIKDLFNKPALLFAVRSYFEIHRDILDKCLCTIFTQHYKMNCADRALMLLNVFGDTTRTIVETISGRKVPLPDEVAMLLMNAINLSRDNLNCLLLESLFNFVSLEYIELSSYMLVETLRVVCNNCTSNIREEARYLVSEFMENNFSKLINFCPVFFSEQQIFEIKAILWCILMALLEDDCRYIRESASRVVASIGGLPRPQLASAAGNMMRSVVANQICRPEERLALMLLLALFDFRSVVRMQDQNNDAYRVFDQSERHNIYLDEVAWTNDFANYILLSYGRLNGYYIKSLLANPVYRYPFLFLCDQNLVQFKRLIENPTCERNENHYWNPKVISLVRLLIK